METYEKLGETAYILSEELGFETGAAEMALDNMEDTGGRHSYHHFRGHARERLENAEEMYFEALAVLDLADNLGLGVPEEEREEEVRLEKEKWFENTSHDYTGSIGEAMDEHLERNREARTGEILSHSTPYHELRKAVSHYERVARHANTGFEGIGGFEYGETEEEAEVIESSGEAEDNPVDLTDRFFSKRI